MEKEKCAIFIDGGYLNKILMSKFSIPKIDYFKFSNEISNKLNLNRLRTYYYTCMPVVRDGNLNDVGKQAKMHKFLTSLKRLPRFEVKLGKLQIIGNQFKQKMVDVLMSLDIATMSYENQIQHVVLIAGDSDFIPTIKKAKDYGVIIHLFYHPSSVHNELLDEVDELHEIKQELVDSCKISD
ncbi:MAG: NYN domain-containing protein [Nanoarchaeota archaeon]